MNFLKRFLESPNFQLKIKKILQSNYRVEDSDE